MASMKMLISIIGVVVLTLNLIKFARWVFVMFIRPAKDLKKFGDWAIVTGATDGIGKAIALELAWKGFNIVLISRTQSKLDAMVKEVEATGRKAETIQIDFADFNEAKREEVGKMCGDKKIGVLVNNVGMSYPSAMFYHELEDGFMDKLNALNCTSVSAMTSIVLPGMLERKGGHVVNISSAASVAPQGLYAGYGATKSYVNNLTENLAREYTKQGIIFSAQIPLWVVSKLAKIRKPTILTPTPKTYAKKAVRHFGYPGVVTPMLLHSIVLYVLDIMPKSLTDAVTMQMHKGIRKAYMKKKAKKLSEFRKQN